MKRNLLISVICLATATVAFGHADDFEVGQNPGTGQIVVEFNPALFPFDLPVSLEPGLAGFALDDPGFVSLDEIEEPGEFEPLASTANIAMKVLSTSSPEFKAWNPADPGGTLITDTQPWVIGNPFFDEHPYWHIDTADANYSPEHGPWTATFQVVDLSGQYLASEPVTVSFVPEPGALALLGLVAAFGLRRR